MPDANVERVVSEILAQRRAEGVSSRNPGPIHWERLSWPRLGEWIDGGKTLVLLPVGAIEQHGPHLPMNTDVAIAEAVACLASAIAGVLVLPAIHYASSIGHTDRWPGTVSLTPETLILACREIGGWLVQSGCTKLIFVNGHFGNDAPLRVAVDRLRTEYLGRLSVATRNTWDLSPEAKRFYLADGDDIHANRAETSLMLAIAPDTVGDYGSADDPDRTEGIVFSYPVALTSTNGVTGRPSEGNAAEGFAMLRVMGEALSEIVERAIVEKPPLERPHGRATSRGTSS